MADNSATGRATNNLFGARSANPEQRTVNKEIFGGSAVGGIQGLNKTPGFGICTQQEDLDDRERGLGQSGFGTKTLHNCPRKRAFNYHRPQELNQDFEVYTNQTFVGCYQREPTEGTKWLRDITDRTLDLQKLDAEIKSYYDANKVTDEETKKKETFRKNLENMIQKYDNVLNLNWNCQLFATGSSISGLAGRGSDLDCCVWIPNGMVNCTFPERTQSFKALQIIREFIYIEVDSGQFGYEIESITLRDAQIPILKIFTKCNLECDLSVCCIPFLSGVHNSLLIKGYTQFDKQRFAPLAMFVKAWANATKLKSPTPPNAKLNSYAITLLLIHFLQCGVWPPVLPNLRQKCGGDFYATSENQFPTYLDITKIPELNLEYLKNEMTMSELFIRFCVYYQFFDYNEYYIDMKEARIRHRSEKGNIEHSKRLYIEDPIDQHNPGRTLYDLPGTISIFEYTVTLFQRAHAYPQKYPFPSAERILKKIKLENGCAPVDHLMCKMRKMPRRKRRRTIRYRGREAREVRRHAQTTRL